MSNYSDLPEGAVVVDNPQQQYSDLPDGAVLAPKSEDVPKSWWNTPVASKTGEYAAQVLHQAARGIPVLGSLTSDSSSNAQFAKDNPTTTGAAKLAGGVASTLPLAAAAPAGVLGQMGLFSGLGGADAAAAGGDAQDIRNKAVLGALGGAAGPFLGKVISPAQRELSPERAGDMVGSVLGSLGGGLEGGVFGHLMADTIGPYVAGPINKYWTNGVAQNPTVKALLNSLSGQIGNVTTYSEKDKKVQ